MYEYIGNSKSFREIVEECNYDDYLDLMFQIGFALLYAQKTIGFVHNDLHSSNILVTVNKFERLKIGHLSIRAKYIIHFIDYGLSRIFFNNRGFGPFGMERFNIDDKLDSRIDIYKLYMDTLLFSRTKNKELFDKIVHLSNYFNIRDVNDEINAGRHNFYCFPPEKLNIVHVLEGFLNDGNPGMAKVYSLGEVSTYNSITENAPSTDKKDFFHSNIYGYIVNSLSKEEFLILFNKIQSITKSLSIGSRYAMLYRASDINSQLSIDGDSSLVPSSL